MSSPTVDVPALNRALRGFSTLLGFELSFQDGFYNLRLTLGDGKGAERTLLCHDVQNLELNPTGDGFTQLPRLEVEDLSDAGLERIHFSLDELERETLFLHCAHLQLL